MNIPNTAVKEIQWNGLFVEIPCPWEVIVLGKKTLIFEVDFQPILEIRWETPSKNIKNHTPDKLIQRMEKELKQPIARTLPPSSLQKTTNGFRTTWLSWQENQVCAAILHCKNCQTLYLASLHVHPSVEPEESLQVLSSLKCHVAHVNESKWAIQDISFHIPKSLSLQNYNLAAGYTQLTFSAPGNLLHICRIAPAMERLKEQGLPVILRTLLGHDSCTGYSELEGGGLQYHRSPTIFDQILTRLRRKKPFCWARLWHNAEKDRLQAVIIESIRPIDIDTTNEICEKYAILHTT